MKASRFSEAQKAFILRQGTDGMPVAEICRKAGISLATYFNSKRSTVGCCRRRCGGSSSATFANSKLRKVVTDFSHDKEILQDVIR